MVFSRPFSPPGSASVNSYRVTRRLAVAVVGMAVELRDSRLAHGHVVKIALLRGATLN
jgi:hypothetical protein